MFGGPRREPFPASLLGSPDHPGLLFLTHGPNPVLAWIRLSRRCFSAFLELTTGSAAFGSLERSLGVPACLPRGKLQDKSPLQVYLSWLLHREEPRDRVVCPLLQKAEPRLPARFAIDLLAWTCSRVSILFCTPVAHGPYERHRYQSVKSRIFGYRRKNNSL